MVEKKSVNFAMGASGAMAGNDENPLPARAVASAFEFV
jgi:hypothetical protein